MSAGFERARHAHKNLGGARMGRTHGAHTRTAQTNREGQHQKRGTLMSGAPPPTHEGGTAMFRTPVGSLLREDDMALVAASTFAFCAVGHLLLRCALACCCGMQDALETSRGPTKTAVADVVANCCVSNPVFAVLTAIGGIGMLQAAQAPPKDAFGRLYDPDPSTHLIMPVREKAAPSSARVRPPPEPPPLSPWRRSWWATKSTPWERACFST